MANVKGLIIIWDRVSRHSVKNSGFFRSYGMQLSDAKAAQSM